MSAVPVTAFSPPAEFGRRLAPLLLVPLLALSGALAAPAGLPAQDTNVLYPVDYILTRLSSPTFAVLDMERARVLETDRSRRVTLGGTEGEAPMEVHWKPVAPGADGFNNQPRYELAAFRFQKLFLDEGEYVVPPVVLRAMELEEYRQYRPEAQPTFRRVRSVLFLLSYWVQNLGVDTVHPFDRELFDRDTVYARHWANLNILTHLIDHKDSNHGNVLVSLDGMNRRVFAVDNDVAFRSQVSDRGDEWRRLHVDRLPARTVERLRAITRAQLDAALEVVAEFEIVDGLLHPVEPGPNRHTRQGVRVANDRVQLGLTSREIGDLENAINRLLRDVDRGRITTF